MTMTHHQVLNDVLRLMTELAGDWEYTGEITQDTRLLADLAMESLGLVVLGTAIQEHYGRLPFSEFLTEIGQRPPEERDLSIGEFVEFICRNKVSVTSGDVA
jgi:acyl carrier protein